MTRSSQLESVQWRDLVALSPWEKAWELGLGLPWLVLSLWCYGCGWWAAGLVGSFYVFLTGLRQSHNAQHYSMGLARIVQDVVLSALSVIMLASMHAVQVTHLHHHRHCLDPEDEEGSTARLPWWRALVIGPFFYVRLHVSAWRLASGSKRGWIAGEVLAIVGLVLAVLFANGWIALRWHVTAMLLGECFTGFFAVWTVHHGCEAHEPGRTQRGRWLNLISYSMFFHAEHHLFPAVPTATWRSWLGGWIPWRRRLLGGRCWPVGADVRRRIVSWLRFIRLLMSAATEQARYETEDRYSWGCWLSRAGVGRPFSQSALGGRRADPIPRAI